MAQFDDPDRTLPSVRATAAGQYRESRLVLTLVFHPDTSRIGETALLPRLRDGEPPIVLGRRSPVFGRPAEPAGGPLNEPHVSRQALAIIADGDGLTLQRSPASSRCRVAGSELNEVISLTREQLERGVPLLLGHAVVALLRLTPWYDIEPAPAVTDHGMCGSSLYMSGLREHIDRIAASDLDVLIRGETGTGKELVAAAIHLASSRSRGPYVSVNMAAIPTGLGAASLFGSARGAFTGAHKASDGYFTQAEGGSLFLDEIGDTPQELQPQLLRALQQREIQLVGGPVRRADVRILSATDVDIEQPDCGFRAALKHRLGACEIKLAPLREHPEDIGELLLYFLSVHSEEAGAAPALPTPRSDGREVAAWAELFHRFLCYEWPGNVRQLANFVGQITVASARVLTVPEGVERELRGPGGQIRRDRVALAAVPARSARKMHQIDDDEFDRAWEDSAFEAAGTARQLGISRQAVYRRIDGSSRYRLAEQVPEAELQRALDAHRGDVGAAALALRVSASGLRARLRAAAAVSQG